MTNMYTIGIKKVRKKAGRRLPRHILRLIENKNRFEKVVKSAKLSSTPYQLVLMEKRLKTLKLEVKAAICDHKITRRKRLRNR